MGERKKVKQAISYGFLYSGLSGRRRLIREAITAIRKLLENAGFEVYVRHGHYSLNPITSAHAICHVVNRTKGISATLGIFTTAAPPAEIEIIGSEDDRNKVAQILKLAKHIK